MRFFLLWLPLFFTSQAEPNRCTSACIMLGECTPAQNGRCVAATSDDCRRGRVCAENGRCTAKQGVCFATTEEDCRASTDCIDEGRCTVFDGYCEARSDIDCRASTGCEAHGACGIRDGECEALAASDCEESMGCARSGLCGLDGGECVFKEPPVQAPVEGETPAVVEERVPAEPPPIQVDGPLKRRGLRSTLRDARHEIARCGELTADVELTATISVKGKPSDIVVVGVPRAMEKCVTKVFKRLRFQEKKRESLLTWRLHRSL